MAHLDHTAAYADFRDKVLEGIRAHFPDGKIAGRDQTLHLEGLEVHEGDLHADDLRAQHQAKVEGRTWAAPVVATLALRDNLTGKTIDRKPVRIAEVPMVTRRHSYIIDGKEYQVDNQWQLKPGVYTRRKQTGVLEAQFNVPNQKSFNVTFDPATKVFNMVRGTSSIPMYPLMKTMGVDDDTLEREWGREILAANRGARGASTAVEKFYRSDRRNAPATKEAAEKYFYETMQKSELRPDSTINTLGKSFTSIDGEVFRRATSKILKVQGGAPEDDRDSLEFKDLRTAGDFVFERLTGYKTARSISDKAQRKINGAASVRDIIKFDTFNEPIKRTFHGNSLVQIPDQTNPVEMLSAAQQTTIMGPGGIKTEQSVVDEAKFINPSHMGFLDPIHTPESSKTGVTLRLPMGAKKVGKELRVPLYNLKTGKTDLVSSREFSQAKIVLPDQVRWDDKGKPHPRSKMLKFSGAGNKIVEGKLEDAQYVMRHASQLFNVTANLIPFLDNTSGNRASYAAHHIEQSVSLRDREAPLVQVSTGVDRVGIRTFEELLGKQSGHPSPVGGTVVKVTKTGITVQDAKGHKREVQIYNNFPLNDAKSVMHSTPLVAVGDKVRVDQPLADTNFTKNGKLALGTNLRVAYIPFKGYNFEDGVVISETAAKKLSSEHMHKPSVQLDDKTITSPKKFQVQHPEAFKRDQYTKLDETGVVKIGQKVLPGDPLIIAMKPFLLKDRMGLGAIRRSLSGQHTDASLRWDSDYAGEVVGVHRKGKDITVHVRTVEPMQIGDKLAGRYGNKGIVTMVLPDKEMPHTKNGKPTEILLNPSGVPGRMNTGQVFETAAAKIAEKTGKPFIVNNFEPGSRLESIQAELKKHGISDTEELIDPVTGVSLGKALVGPQHILKLKHQIDKKIAVRSGSSWPGHDQEMERYDFNLMPAQGSKTGGQSIGHLGFNALLAHGAKANIREMQTWKSEGPDPQSSEGKRWPSQHTDVWNKIQLGEPLPVPQPTFAFQKFTDMLRAAGINIEKKGHTFQLGPMTDKQIKQLSSGALPKPTALTYPKVDKDGEPKPITGGLFDPKLTGGHGGKKWSHIELAEPIPNPIFAGAIQKVLGLSEKDYDSLAAGERGVSKSGEIVKLDAHGAIAGGPAIQHLLSKIDVDRDLAAAERELSHTTLPSKVAHGASTSKVDKLLKKVKYLRALKQVGIKPDEAYLLHNLPVIPPAMRPASVLPDGNIKWADLNGLYQQFAQINSQLGDPKLANNLTHAGKQRMRSDLYDGLKALMGTTSTTKDVGNKGILQQIHGSQPKEGYFQKTLMNRRQDLTMRSVIAPDPALGLDEVGLPEEKAMTLYRPFVVRKLVEIGAAAAPLDAQKLIKDKSEASRRALEYVAAERPVIIKRDPALHKHSVMAFKPRLVRGRAIQIHPLVTSGFNADFDGDMMSAYVPISREAVEEAHKMFPTNHLFNEATGSVAYQPTLESALGLYKISLITDKKAVTYKTPADALKAVQERKLTVNDPIVVGGTRTTPGRLLLADALPAVMRNNILKSSDIIDKKGLGTLFSKLAKEHSDEFGVVADKLKDIGNGMSFGAIPVMHPDHKGPSLLYAKERPKDRIQFIPTGTHTLSLDDFKTDTGTRDHILDEAQRKVDGLKKQRLSEPEFERRAIDIWLGAAKRMEDEHTKKISVKPNNLAMMHFAGVKPSFDQYKQMVLAPVLVEDNSGKLIATPIKQSYSEGLDTAGYWTQMSGARRGSVMKVQEVRDPGYLSKQLVNTAMNLLVTAPDCGTTRGTSLSIGSRDVHDRVLAKDIEVKNNVFKAGTILTTDIIDKIRAADKHAQLVVRSPLKCEHDKGICQKCAGLGPGGKMYNEGVNLGVLAAQSLGERSMQLTLKAFHSGGVQSSGGSRLINQFGRIGQLTRLPKDIPDSSTLAMKSGTIDKVERDPTGLKVWVGGVAHHIGKDRSGAPLYENLPGARSDWHPPKAGMKVVAGQSLSDPGRTLVNPHQLYRATGSMERVQNFLVDALHEIYGKEGVRRQHVETMVKAMSNLTKVRDEGDADYVLRGEFRPHSEVVALNAKLVKENKKPVQHSPILQGVDMLPLSVQEDWMAKLMHSRLRDTLQEAASSGSMSNIHGLHPIPGAAFGAEFGLTSKDALKPGLGKLKNVPRYAY